MNPLVSFIIPYYNSIDTIEETINSIINQSYKNYEIWIINDGSNTKSTKKLNSFKNNPKIKILQQDNAGPSIARNNAIKKTKAEYIISLDADDKICENTISKNLKFLIENPSVGVVYGNLKYFGEKEYILNQTPKFELKKQFLMNQIAICCIIKKSVFETAGYYDKFLSKPGLEDWEFWMRVSEYGWEFKKVEEVFFNIRLTAKSRTFEVANKNLDTIHNYVYKKHNKSLIKEYEKLYYQEKMLIETPDYKIGNILLKPYRLIKRLFKNT